ncbi:hypothetical protein [Mucilaginibacter dorajii]|uniref:Uncharacterized protein n=1 Tax=Mucilaginibacter dorajii TaxID=692994 RepID=A0ABP7Q9J5_9SPHI|nr:hypothetical protein [Mucilaginibacter dorajii]MCS3737076.1 hypothetical protein [Mucilaginibacter dorajii]
MKKATLLFNLIAAAIITAANPAHAQFGGLLQKAKDKAAQKASDALDKKTSTAQTQNQTTTKSNRATINEGFDFVPGDTLLLAEDFANIPTGSSTHTFKTNGSASVVAINGQDGKWLALGDNATYKFTKQIFYPKHFTIEFDIFTAVDVVKDIYPITTGFINDNSVKDYNSGTGAYLQLKYYNNDDIEVYSSFISKNLNTRFDLTAYANRPMHISMNVDGDRMAVYIDKTKIADTLLFLPTTAKNFFISGPMQYQNGAKALVSNFRIMGFKKS